MAHLDRYKLARLDKYGPEIDDKMKAQNLLCGAIVAGDLVLVQSLLRGSQSPTTVVVNKESPYFGRPLHLAAAWGHLEIVQYLLDSGADPHLRTDGDEDDWNRCATCASSSSACISGSRWQCVTSSSTGRS